jgi:hypothetical protein
MHLPEKWFQLLLDSLLLARQLLLAARNKGGAGCHWSECLTYLLESILGMKPPSKMEWMVRGAVHMVLWDTVVFTVVTTLMVPPGDHRVRFFSLRMQSPSLSV